MPRLLALLPVLLPALVPAADTAALNGGFESAPGTWPWRPTATGAECQVVEDLAWEGRASARIRLLGRDAGAGSWSQRLLLRGSRSPLRAACRVRTAGLAPGAAAHLALRFLDVGNAPMGEAVRSPAPTGGQAWAPLEVEGTPPAGAAVAVCSLALAGRQGTAWFDGVTVEGGPEEEDPFQLSARLPGRNLLGLAEFSGFAPGTPVQELPGWVVEGHAAARVVAERPFTSYLSSGILAVDGASPGSLVRPFPPQAAGRLRIAFNLHRAAGDGAIRANLHLRDAHGNRALLLGWDAGSFAKPRQVDLVVPGGRRVLPANIPRHTAIFPEPWRDRYLNWLLTLVAEPGRGGEPGRLYIGGNVEAEKQDYRSLETLYPLDPALRDAAALELEVVGGDGPLRLSNLLIDGPVPASRDLDRLIAERRAGMAAAATAVPADGLPGDGEYFRGKLIYQTSPAIHTPDGRLSSYHRLIPGLKELGVDILYFTCLWKSTRYTPGGHNGFPEWDGMQVSPNLGSEEDLRELVRDLHANGIAVMVDFGFHSAAWDSPLLREHPEWFRKFAGGPFNGWPIWESEPYVYLARYDHGLQAVQDHLIEVGRHWVRDIGIDVMRQDLAYALFMPRADAGSQAAAEGFWRAFKSAMLAENPRFRMLGECANQGAMRNGFDLQYTGFWRFRIQVLGGLIHARGRPAGCMVHALREWLPRENPEDGVFLFGLESHDFGPASGSDGGGGSELNGFGSLATANLYMGIIAALPGATLLFGGQEWDNRYRGGDLVPAERSDPATYAYYRRLIALRRGLALGEGALADLVDLTPGGAAERPVYRPKEAVENRRRLREYVDASRFPAWVAFGRRTSAGRFAVLANHGDQPADIVPRADEDPAWNGLRATRMWDLTSGAERACDQALSTPWRVAPWSLIVIALAEPGGG